MTRLVWMRDAESMIREAMEWMVTQERERRPFVIIESKSTGRFVQFCTKETEDNAIVLDLPGRKENLPRYRLAQQMFGDPTLWRCDTSTGISYQKRCSGVEDAVSVALATLTECLLIGSTDTLIIGQDCTDSPN